MDIWNLILFCTAAVLLLGSPGPAIAALIAVGRKYGFMGGLPFYIGLQFGLASAAGISAAGLFSLLQSISGATTVMAMLATAYLVYLSIKIAMSPPGEGATTNGFGFAETAAGGFLLGITNPKAYMAFVSIMASYAIIPSNATADVSLKWLICVVVMIIVDIIWLWFGDIIRKVNLSLKAERALNFAMGATIFTTAFLALL